jgi:hypothetical protein
LQTFSYCLKLWTRTACYYFYSSVSCFNVAIISTMWHNVSLILENYESNIEINPFKSLLISYYTQNFLLRNFLVTVPSDFGTVLPLMKASWISVSSLNMYIPEMYFCIPSISYLVYRGSLQTVCNNCSRITIKQRILSIKYPKVKCFYVTKKESDSKDMDSSSFGLIFSKQLKCDF